MKKKAIEERLMWLRQQVPSFEYCVKYWETGLGKERSQREECLSHFKTRLKEANEEIIKLEFELLENRKLTLTGKALKDLRTKHNLTRKQMTSYLNVTNAAIKHYEDADKLSFKRLKQYCVILEEKEILHVLNKLEELL